MQETKVTNN